MRPENSTTTGIKSRKGGDRGTKWCNRYCIRLSLSKEGPNVVLALSWPYIFGIEQHSGLQWCREIHLYAFVVAIVV
jgi:hypothetical protein